MRAAVLQCAVARPDGGDVHASVGPMSGSLVDGNASSSYPMSCISLFKKYYNNRPC
jgi:hypothetical protein